MTDRIENDISQMRQQLKADNIRSSTNMNTTMPWARSISIW